MELWIRVQKNKDLKEGLVKVDDLMVDTDSDGKWCMYQSCNTLGIYKTKERALEILDEIQNLMLYDFKRKNSAECLINGTENLFIYVMPQD